MCNLNYHNVKIRIPDLVQRLGKISPEYKYEAQSIGEAISLLLVLNDILNNTTNGDSNE